MKRLTFLVILSGLFVSLLNACSSSNGEDMIAVEPQSSVPTSQPSHTPRPSWTPWPTKTPTPTPTFTPDPRAAFITPETQVIQLPQVNPLNALQDRDLPPNMMNGSTSGEQAQPSAQESANNNSLFDGLESSELDATPTPRASATSTPSPSPTPTDTPSPSATGASTETATEAPTARPSETVVANASTSRPTPDFIPTNTPDCFNFLQFVDDITIPDGEEITQGAQFTKTWRVINLGSCYISSEYRFFALNEAIEVIAVDPLPLIGPDEEGNLSVTLRAPSSPGRYRSNWQLQPEGGEAFGQLYLEIVVPE